MYDEFTIMSEDGMTVQSVVLSKDFETIMANGGAGQAPTGMPSRAAEPVTALSNGGAQIDLASILVPGGITIVDFYADWCGPCRVMAPDLESLARQDPRVYLRKVDIVTWGTPVAAQFGISSIPNVRVFGTDGKMIGEPTHDIAEVRSLVRRAQ
jgi:thiol-disulfide isomerase/thioredoxin